MSLRRSRLADALADATRAREGFVAIGDRWREALCHELLGAVASYGGKHDLAEEEHGAAVRLYRSLGRRHELPRALGNLARAYVHQQKLGPAREAADHALAVAREQGSWRQLEEAAMLGGTIALAEERWEDAEEHFTAGIEQAEGVGERGWRPSRTRLEDSRGCSKAGPRRPPPTTPGPGRASSTRRTG